MAFSFLFNVKCSKFLKYKEKKRNIIIFSVLIYTKFKNKRYFVFN